MAAHGTRSRYNNGPCRCEACTEAQRLYQRDRHRQRAAHDYHLWRTYGITADEFDSMLEAQGGACAICGTTSPDPESGRRKRMSVDHDHETGEVRGLLCNRCNRGIGMFQENAEILVLAAFYLSQSDQMANQEK